MTERLQAELQTFLKIFEEKVDSYIKDLRELSHGKVPDLVNSIEYSLKSGGKRFRPFLSYLVFRCFSDDIKKLLTFSLALELIHTYSLIHDDLPAMDNDDLRRGKPTNHKMYGEDIALLAGDSLISEAFRIIAEDTELSDSAKVKLVKQLARKIGPFGMVAGQVLDIKTSSAPSFDEINLLHDWKTGNLILMAALGPKFILDLPAEEKIDLYEFGVHLGMAFQLKDDILDFSNKNEDFKNYAQVFGIEDAEKRLVQNSNHAKNRIAGIRSEHARYLYDLIDYNLSRTS